jgi:glycosyltransferase involved in cell wall biosynthesis
VKGLVEFINQIPENFADNNVWLIAGDGSLQNTLEETIVRKGLGQAVRLLGYVNHNKMPELYAAADIFLLPSLTDPNPLSAIEAAFAGLPLLISTRLGNFPELLQQGITGWGFDPYNPKETKQALMQAMTCSEAHLTKMSDQVKRVANDFFDCDTVCNRLLDFLLQTHAEMAGN